MKNSTLTLLLLFLTTLSFGQIVNIENKRLSDQKDGFIGSADLNLNFVMNTRQLFQIGDKVKLGYKKKKHFAFLITDHALVKSDDNSFVNRGYEHLRYNYTLKDSGRVTLEVFQQGQFNKIQRIDLRLLLGSGFRFKILDHKNYQMNLGTSVMGEYERLSDTGISTTDILNSTYFSFDGQFTESFGMNTIVYFQPKLTDIGTYRIANETSLRFKLSDHFTFKLVYYLAHDSRNIEGVRKTNYTLKNTFSFRF
ncbi:MAG: DUF481 domain-containing protein [Crocinitomicaceae bacterium]|nr:DUF481 domain-containing protein [Crocinitomicaceae bacterium]